MANFKKKTIRVLVFATIKHGKLGEYETKKNNVSLNKKHEFHKKSAIIWDNVLYVTSKAEAYRTLFGGFMFWSLIYEPITLSKLK